MSFTPPRIRQLDDDDPIYGYFQRADPIDLAFPIHFSCGTEVDDISSGCKICGTPHDPSETRGELHADGPDSYRATVVALCRPCKTLCQNVYRFTASSIEDITRLVPDQFARHPTKLPPRIPRR